MNEPKDYEYLLLCDGSTISEDNYPELVAVLGGTQLPNLIDRFLQGSATAGTYKKAGLPNITGTGPVMRKKFVDGCFATDNLTSNYLGSGTNIYLYTYEGSSANPIPTFNARRCSTVYGNSTTVQPPAFTAKIYICYAG